MDKQKILYDLSCNRKALQVEVDALAEELKIGRKALRELTGHIDRLLGEIEADEAQS